MTARTLGIILSLWLFFSAFAFPRTGAGFATACVAGLLSAAASLVGFHRPRARFVATVLSAWVVAAAFLVPQRTPAARWNDLGVGLALLLVSLVPGTMYLPERRPAHP